LAEETERYGNVKLQNPNFKTVEDSDSRFQDLLMNDSAIAQKILASRRRLIDQASRTTCYKAEEEGGCGVTGFASSIPVGGKHIFEPSVQMHNRGNGKGGGIAAAGLCADDLGVSREILDDDYLLQIAFLDPAAREQVERECVLPFFKIDSSGKIPAVDDYRDIEGLETRPPDVWRYFVRVQENVLKDFIARSGLQAMPQRKAEDEFVYQNSYRLNQQFYASLGEKKAFVLSHGRDMLVLKIVGYAEKVAQYYQLENFKAHIWIAHQRYPTKGRVWHPGGAHPFIGMHEALVHNGDFANYHSVSEYLRQRNIVPQFLTDTEVSVLLFDLWNRVYEYPLEYIIEALAPTGEMDFDCLPPEKQKIYRAIQASHIHGSPDGPWFFIIARHDPYTRRYQLIGITDTSMLRPQVFALQEADGVQIGLVCSEKQAIDATLHSLSQEDKRFSPIADKYWNARGGSHTDGGSFLFEFTKDSSASAAADFTCTDKFGKVISTPKDKLPADRTIEIFSTPAAEAVSQMEKALEEKTAWQLFQFIRDNLARWDFNTLSWCCQRISAYGAAGDDCREKAIEALTLLIDFRYDTGAKKRSSILEILHRSLHELFAGVPKIAGKASGRFVWIDWQTRAKLRSPKKTETTLIIYAKEFPPEGDECDARLICAAFELGWKRFMVYGLRGQRFQGCGLGPDTEGVRIDVYDSSGDYLASGIDGLEIFVHGNAQDQLGQILKAGKLVIYGDVGQTFLYGAKGGEVYVQGNAAGRPLINAVGRPRVVINGTCLDYLAESCMAGDPLKGGGFVILNGLEFDDNGAIREQAAPYPGSNLFSLASGGAIYVRDPQHTVVAEQLNGGAIIQLTPEDWSLILPYLQENEKLFGISIEKDLLTVNGARRKPEEVYRKVAAVKLAVLTDVDDDA